MTPAAHVTKIIPYQSSPQTLLIPCGVLNRELRPTRPDPSWIKKKSREEERESIVTGDCDFGGHSEEAKPLGSIVNCSGSLYKRGRVSVRRSRVRERAPGSEMALVRNPNLKLLLPDTRPHSSLFLQPPAPPSGLPDKPSPEIGALSDLETVSTLGHGNGGTVYKVRHKRTSNLYALKLVQIPSSDSESGSLLRSQVGREMDILARTDSPHVVRCHGIFKKDAAGDVALVLEYMDSGSLETLARRTGTLSEDVLASVARQVLLGLNYLHGLKIVHRDIKPSNLLVNGEMEVKISDFGVSKVMVRRLETCASYVGTNAYMSPERFDPETNGGCYDAFAGDIWSLGVTLWELYVGYFPLLPSGQRPDWATLMCAICFGDMPDFPENASPEFNDFLSCCLRKDSNKRSTVSDLLGHPFVARDRDAPREAR
ncbi:hypothetical protein H6P81_015291 [Aristolochia fimbriata]|uniref:mitogen-activated protein kinase kinase n=1 Tax=Aristolochia fimbriata TaxID=158543 RepID=A0AAV7E7Z0_ARIFI|nr:hypothetical protein H6P81_015291 [Aristolochia fimbriata]